MKKFLILLAAVFGLTVSAIGRCDVCEARLPRRYLTSGDKNFCSKDCYYTTLPKCSYCKEPCRDQAISVMGKTFCNLSCCHRVFRCSQCKKGLDSKVFSVTNGYGQRAYYCARCREFPQCYFCALPTSVAKEADGRSICRNCRLSSVDDEQEIKDIFQQIRRDLNKMFGYDTAHEIDLQIVDVKQLDQVSQTAYLPEGGKRMALMRYRHQEQMRRTASGKMERRIINEKCQIFVLSKTPKPLLYDAIAHELTHDHIRHHIGSVKDLAREEGFCELIAYLYNQKQGRKRVNRAKEINKDPVYGEGFRKMLNIYQRTKSFRQTLKYVK